jgi:hypothetical protein
VFRLFLFCMLGSVCNKAGRESVICHFATQRPPKYSSDKITTSGNFWMIDTDSTVKPFNWRFLDNVDLNTHFSHISHTLFHSITLFPNYFQLISKFKSSQGCAWVLVLALCTRR